MTTAPFLSRHFGDYLLVARLSEDALGTVFRALYVADERRFVRLRILQSAELDPEAVRRAVGENAGRALSHDAIVRQEELGLVEGVPCLSWYETSGWTLDALLARVRGLGIRVPPEYALLIAERIAAALEHAHRTAVNGEPMAHGLLWPGFVSLSNDSEVRLGGFGLAPAVLPALASPRLSAEIAPYVAPEARGRAAAATSSDVYSLGAILLELLTGRRPCPDAPLADLGEGDPSSRELGAFLCLTLAADPAERFASALEMHRALQELLTGSPYALYTANLALFLYKLLNPESQSVAPSSDWESTNPVVIGAAEGATEEEPRSAAAETAEDAAPPDPAITRAAADLLPEGESDETARKAPPAAEAEPAAARAPTRHAWNWTHSLAAGVTAAGIAAGLLLVARDPRGERREIAPLAAEPAPAHAAAQSPPATRAAEPIVPASPGENAARDERPGTKERPQASGTFGIVSLRPADAARGAKASAVSVRGRRNDLSAARTAAQDARFAAAFARIAAERVEAGDLAGEIHGEAKKTEEEGERLLRERDYDGTAAVFRRAAHLYRQAERISFEERVRRVKLSSGE